ncbi:MAG: hypothetical protein ACRCYV_02080 [Aeromonas sp.]
MQQPPVIVYNLKQRGRQFRGQERDFNIPGLVAAINGPATQERVKTRGMLGYLGHWPRIRFGMEPPEGGLFGGKAHAVEPAVVTVFLKAHANGDIEHQTEFLDNEAGNIASRMFANRVGGFSSAIDPVNCELYGFDWVNDPNYSTNRGYDLALDSAAEGGVGFIEVLMAEQAERLEAQELLLNALELQAGMALDSAQRLARENDELLDLLAAHNARASKSLANAVLDNAGFGLMRDEQARQARDRQLFLDATHLPQPVSPATAVSEEAERDYLQLSRRVLPYV